jgi:hypothetical protein
MLHRLRLSPTSFRVDCTDDRGRYQHYFNDTEMPLALSMFATINDQPISSSGNLVVNCTEVAACDGI